MSVELGGASAVGAASAVVYEDDAQRRRKALSAEHGGPCRLQRANGHSAEVMCSGVAQRRPRRRSCSIMGERLASCARALSESLNSGWTSKKTVLTQMKMLVPFRGRLGRGLTPWFVPETYKMSFRLERLVTMEGGTADLGLNDTVRLDHRCLYPRIKNQFADRVLKL